MMQEAGFAVGVHVMQKGKPDDKCVIVSITGDDVVVKDADETEIKLTAKKLVSSYAKYETTNFPSSAMNDARGNTAFNQNGQKGAVAAALWMLSSNMPAPKVRVQAKPVKKVVAIDGVKKDQLVLVPETTVVQLAEPKLRTHPSAAAVDIDGKTVYLMPPAQAVDPAKQSLISAYWNVRTSEDEAAVNLTWSTRRGRGGEGAHELISMYTRAVPEDPGFDSTPPPR